MSTLGRNRRDAGRLDAFGEKTNLEQVADDIFGASPAPELNTGRVVARPVALEEIWADVRQPRRVIPASVRLHWNGNPGAVPTLLNTWAGVAANAAGRHIDREGIILGEGDGLDTDGTPSVYESYVALLRLAGSILRDGLINPITIVNRDGHYMVESGERRLLAYWLLRLYTNEGESFSRIPAVIVSDADYVWRQAAENTARRNLNAVGMARQLALLVMAARGEDQYRVYDAIVQPGGSDRRYYAQIADGNIHRIPRGAGERIQSAMGLSMEQLSQYRALLRLGDDEQVNDALWLRADVEDWPENAMREIRPTLTVVKVRELILGDSPWTLGDLREAAAAANPSPSPSPQAGRGTGLTVEAQDILDDLRAGYRLAFHMAHDGDALSNLAASSTQRLLNQAQRHYDDANYTAARQALEQAYQLIEQDATRRENETVEDVPAATSGTQRQLSMAERRQILTWAWRWGKGHREGGGWFTKQDSTFVQPGDLGTLILDGHLEQGTMHKGNLEIVRYRITPVGCRFLGAGFEVLDWDQGATSTSDNPVSVPQKPVIWPGDSAFPLLTGLRNLANLTGKLGASDAVTALLAITEDALHQLTESGQKGDVLQAYYDSINNALGDWSQEIGELLDRLHNQG